VGGSHDWSGKHAKCQVLETRNQAVVARWANTFPDGTVPDDPEISVDPWPCQPTDVTCSIGDAVRTVTEIQVDATPAVRVTTVSSRWSRTFTQSEQGSASSPLARDPFVICLLSVLYRLAPDMVIHSQRTTGNGAGQIRMG
jgi:hypothetical protein